MHTVCAPEGAATPLIDLARPSARRAVPRAARNDISISTTLRDRPRVLLVFLSLFDEASTVLKGIAHYQRTHRQWSAFLDDEAKAEKMPEWIRSAKWYGVISRHTTPALARRCAEMNIPLVDLNDSPILRGVPKVRPDNTTIGHIGAEHFIERGFSHFGYCGYHDQGWSCERREGFREALRLVRRDCHVFDIECPGHVTPFNDETQVADLSEWLLRLPKPVAIMAAHDLRALQVLNAAGAAGLLVPEEVALLGVNNDAVRCELAYPSISSVAPNGFQAGFLAAEMLDTLMQGRPLGQLDARIEPVGVKVRRSSDSLAISDRAVAAALSCIREHACSGIKVPEVATHVSASRSQLEKKFRAILGRSPQCEIRRVQVAKIKQLLSETDLPLKTIAELTGFEHMEYMCVVFKRIANLSPGAYRKAVRFQGRRDN